MGALLDDKDKMEALKYLMDKFSIGFEYVLKQKTPSKIAVNDFIQEVQNSDLSPINKAAIIFDAKKIIKEYSNQKDIFEIATKYLNDDAAPQNVEDDWFAQYMDKARLVSNKEFQEIWGHILADECNNPNTIPRGLLHILEQMDCQDAKAFTSICRIAICVDDDGANYYPVINESHLQDYYSMLDITYDSLVDLQALGLIEMSFGFGDIGYSVRFEKTPVVINYHEHQYKLSVEKNSINVGNVILTKCGHALCRSINVTELAGFWEKYCLPFLEQQFT